MTAIYRTTQVGSGTSSNSYRPSGFDGLSYSTLMLGENRPSVLLVSTSNGVTGGGAVKLLEAENLEALKTLARTTSPTSQQLQGLNVWANSNGLSPAPAGLNWTETIHYLAQQVNSAANLETLFLFEG